MRQVLIAFGVWVLAMGALVSSGCSGYRLRKGSLSRSPEEIGAALSEIGSRLGLASDQNSFAKVQALIRTPGATVYASEAPGDLGTLDEVMPLRFDSIVNDLKDPNRSVVGAVKRAWIYYVHVLTDQGFRGGLVINADDSADQASANFSVVMVNDGATPDAAAGGQLSPGQVIDGAFQMPLNHGSPDSTMYVYSEDLDPSEEDLAEVIQLKFFVRNRSGDGGLSYIGKVNTMVSY